MPFLSLFFENLRRLVLERNYLNEGFVACLLAVYHCTVYKRVKCVVLSHTYIEARVVNRTPLTNDDVASLYTLATELLETQAFAF